MFRAFQYIILFFLIAPDSFSQVDYETLEHELDDREKVSYIAQIPDKIKEKEATKLLEILYKLKETTEKNNNYRDLVNIQLQIFDIEYVNGNYVTVIPELNYLLENNQLLTTQDSVQIYYLLKKSYVALRNSAKAFETHKMLEAFDKRGLIKDRFLMNPPLSDIYIELGLYAQAMKQLRIEHNERAAMGSLTPIEEVQFNNNAGVFFKKWRMYDSATFHFNQAFHYLKPLLAHNPGNESYVFFDGLISGNKGSVLELQEKYAEAIPLLKKDVIISTKTGYYESAAHAYLGLADCYSKMGEHQNARASMDSAFVMFTKSGHPSNEYEAYKTNAGVYLAAKNFEAATREYGKYIRVKDSIVQSDLQRQVVNDQVAFELDKKESQLQEQKLRIEENQIALEKNKGDKMILLVAIVAIALISIILFVANKNSNKKQKELEKKNEEISSKNLVIEQALNDKDALIKEVHHRVKNNLQIISSLLRLQSAKQTDDQIQTMFDESVKRIQSMALVHELLYRNKNLNSIPVHTYIQNLADGLSSSYGMNSRISITVHCEPAQIDIDTVVPLGLIVNELVTNSIKHAFDTSGGRIDIVFEKAGDKHRLIVKDNGKGLPTNFESLKENSLGMELVDALADQISAQYTCESNKGVKFEFLF